MASFDIPEKSVVNDWVEAQTRQLDVVASWESLCDTYRMLEFSDPISDTARMEEYKWIIAEMNKHLTRARRQLMSCKDLDSVRETLRKMFVPSGDVNISNRMALTYHKLRQIWVTQMLAELEMLEEQMKEEGNLDG